ncbi:MAG: hypothetical protein ACLVG9_00275 [Eubacteriales bacterium]
MKKYISLALVLGMLLTVVGIIPAEAKAYEAYPYIYSDFEDPSSLSELKSTQNDMEWVEGGAGGSAGALHITQKAAGTDGKGAMSDHYFFVPDAHFMVNGKFKMSAWVKLDTAKTKLAKTNFGFAFWGPAYDKSGQKNPTRWMTGWTVDNEKFNNGEWVYVEKLLTGTQ